MFSRSLQDYASSLLRLSLRIQIRGDEWSLRAFARMRALRIFASTSRDKKFALRAASSLESTTREQRAFVI